MSFDLVFFRVFALKNDSPKFLVYFFPTYRLCINFDKKWVGLHFGRFFHELIWPPWSFYLFGIKKFPVYVVHIAHSDSIYLSMPQRPTVFDNMLKVTRIIIFIWVNSCDGFGAGLPDFSWYNIPIRGKYPN
jgi:hypothetical protein